MRFNQFDKAEYKDILLFSMEQNDHGGYPFCINIVSPDNTAHTMHRHEYFQIYYIAKGKLKHLINNEEVELNKGDLFVIPPYVPHSVAKYENVRCEAIELEFNPELINQSFGYNDDVKSSVDFMYIEPFMVNESKVKPRMNLTGKIESDVESIIDDFIHEFNEKKPGFELIIKSMILRLLALVGRELTIEIKTSDKDLLDVNHQESVLRVVKYIEENYTETIYLEDAVKVSLLCHSYFCSIFKSITSKSFTQYLNDLRVSKAKEFLKRTDIKIIDICSKTGFENVTHFNRTFKQLTSMTPKEYKQVSRSFG